MGSDTGKQKVKFKEKVEIETVTSYIEGVLSGIKSGKVCIQRDGDIVCLKPNGLVDLEIEGVSKSNKEKLSIELSWKKQKEIKEVTPLNISSREDDKQEGHSPENEIGKVNQQF